MQLLLWDAVMGMLGLQLQLRDAGTTVAVFGC